MRSVHRDDSSIIDSREESNKTYLGKEKRIGRPLQYRAASSLISSEKKRRKRDDNRPTLIPISSVYRKQGKENFAFDICSIQRIRIDIRRYSIRVHESTGFVREKCIVHSSVWAPFYADGTYWINQPEGNSVSIEICHEFSFPSIHSPPPSSSTIRFSQRDPKRLFDNRCWWNRSYKSGIDFHWKKFNNFLLLYGIWILGQRRILVTLYIYIYYVLIKYSYCFTNLPFWISSLYNSFLAKNRDSISLISKGKSILFTRCRVYLYNLKKKK